MVCKYWKTIIVIISFGIILCASSCSLLGTETKEIERKVTKADVPAAALSSLKKLADGAEITEFAEEIDKGNTFYEGSWETSLGIKTDVLVTASGDLVEIEEQVSENQVPDAVLKLARETAGQGNPLTFEKKTFFLYEVKFEKGNKEHEILLTPDARHAE